MEDALGPTRGRRSGLAGAFLAALRTKARALTGAGLHPLLPLGSPSPKDHVLHLNADAVAVGIGRTQTADRIMQTLFQIRTDMNPLVGCVRVVITVCFAL